MATPPTFVSVATTMIMRLPIERVFFALKVFFTLLFEDGMCIVKLQIGDGTEATVDMLNLLVR
jgi:hypothetical protein